MSKSHELSQKQLQQLAEVANAGQNVQQVFPVEFALMMGNSDYLAEVMIRARFLREQTINPEVSLGITEETLREMAAASHAMLDLEKLFPEEYAIVLSSRDLYQQLNAFIDELT